MTTMNNAANINSIVDDVKFYVWVDKKGKVHKCLSFKFLTRLVSEKKGTEPDESKGFARLARDVKERVKALNNGSKIYWSAYVYKTNIVGTNEQEIKIDNFIRNDMGDRVQEAGWLVDMGDTYNEKTALASLEIFKQTVTKGLADGVLEVKPEKAPEKKKAELIEELKQANETIRILKLRCERYEKELAELKAK